MSDERFPLTTEQAISLLPDGDTVHNFKNPGAGMFLGCDYSREAAENAIRNARSIEVGGDACRGMRHPIAVFDENGKLSFFEADMDKLSAFEGAEAALSKARGQ